MFFSLTLHLYILSTSYCLIKYMKEIHAWRCHVVYVVMRVVVLTSGCSPSAFISGLIRRIDRGDPNQGYI